MFVADSPGGKGGESFCAPPCSLSPAPHSRWYCCDQCPQMLPAGETPAARGLSRTSPKGDLTTWIGPISFLYQLKTSLPSSAPALRGPQDPGAAAFCPILDFTSTRAAPVAPSCTCAAAVASQGVVFHLTELNLISERCYPAQLNI